MAMRLVILDGHCVNPGDLDWAPISSQVETTVYDYTAPEEVIAHIGTAELVMTNKTVIDRTVLDACPTIRYVGVLATGYNVVDIAECARRGVVVTNVPAYSTDTVAQYVFALLLELCHRVGHHNEAVQAGRWSQTHDFCFWDFPGVELAGKTMGIIGYGRIGQATAKLAHAFGMRVIATSPHGSAPELVPLDTLLAQSDVISLHCRLTPENTGIICRENLQKMKDGVMLINTARGQLINAEDLREALLSGKVSGAALDVMPVEPLPAGDNPLLGLDNCIITPHIAWAAKECRQRLMGIAAENLRCFMIG